MTLFDLYQIKLYEYKKFGLRDEPYKLLAILLLIDKDNYTLLNESYIDFYLLYKKDIDKLIEKLENDFNFTQKDLKLYFKENVSFDNYDGQKIRFVYAKALQVLIWGLIHKEYSAEEIYTIFLKNDNLAKKCDIEFLALVKGINITNLNTLLSKILKNPSEFYKSVCRELSTEERLFILETLENKSCMNCTNGSCSIEYRDKLGNDEFGNQQGSKCVGWYNEELIGRSKVLKRININQLM